MSETSQPVTNQETNEPNKIELEEIKTKAVQEMRQQHEANIRQRWLQYRHAVAVRRQQFLHRARLEALRKRPAAPISYEQMKANKQSVKMMIRAGPKNEKAAVDQKTPPNTTERFMQYKQERTAVKENFTALASAFDALFRASEDKIMRTPKEFFIYLFCRPLSPPFEVDHSPTDFSATVAEYRQILDALIASRDTVDPDIQSWIAIINEIKASSRCNEIDYVHWRLKQCVRGNPIGERKTAAEVLKNILAEIINNPGYESTNKNGVNFLKFLSSFILDKELDYAETLAGLDEKIADEKAAMTSAYTEFSRQLESIATGLLQKIPEVRNEVEGRVTGVAQKDFDVVWMDTFHSRMILASVTSRKKYFDARERLMTLEASRTELLNCERTDSRDMLDTVWHSAAKIRPAVQKPESKTRISFIHFDDDTSRIILLPEPLAGESAANIPKHSTTKILSTVLSAVYPDCPADASSSSSSSASFAAAFDLFDSVTVAGVATDAAEATDAADAADAKEKKSPESSLMLALAQLYQECNMMVEIDTEIDFPVSQEIVSTLFSDECVYEIDTSEKDRFVEEYLPNCISGFYHHQRTLEVALKLKRSPLTSACSSILSVCPSRVRGTYSTVPKMFGGDVESVSKRGYDIMKYSTRLKVDEAIRSVRAGIPYRDKFSKPELKRNPPISIVPAPGQPMTIDGTDKMKSVIGDLKEVTDLTPMISGGSSATPVQKSDGKLDSADGASVFYPPASVGASPRIEAPVSRIKEIRFDPFICSSPALSSSSSAFPENYPMTISTRHGVDPIWSSKPVAVPPKSVIVPIEPLDPVTPGKPIESLKPAKAASSGAEDAESGSVSPLVPTPLFLQSAETRLRAMRVDTTLLMKWYTIMRTNDVPEVSETPKETPSKEPAAYNQNGDPFRSPNNLMKINEWDPLDLDVMSKSGYTVLVSGVGGNVALNPPAKKEATEVAKNSAVPIIVLLNDVRLQTLVVVDPSAAVFELAHKYHGYGFVPLYYGMCNETWVRQYLVDKMHRKGYNSVDELNQHLKTIIKWVQVAVTSTEEDKDGGRALMTDKEEEELVSAALKENYILSNNLQQKIKSSVLCAELMSCRNMLQTKLNPGFANRLPHLLIKAGLQKKRYNDGFYYYGIQPRTAERSPDDSVNPLLPLHAKHHKYEPLDDTEIFLERMKLENESRMKIRTKLDLVPKQGKD